MFTDYTDSMGKYTSSDVDDDGDRSPAAWRAANLAVLSAAAGMQAYRGRPWVHLARHVQICSSHAMGALKSHWCTQKWRSYPPYHKVQGRHGLKSWRCLEGYCGRRELHPKLLLYTDCIASHVVTVQCAYCAVDEKACKAWLDRALCLQLWYWKCR